MTRIVAGTWGGRTLEVPAKDTRPTSERVREAIFSRLEHAGFLDDAAVLDLFAGSGALGIEAVSRGAASAVLVEASAKAAAVANRNAKKLHASQIHVVTEKAHRFVARPGSTWDVVFIDPPYDLAEDDLAQVIELVVGAMHPDGVLVIERSTRSPEPTIPAAWFTVATKTYGETAVYYVELATDDDAA